MSKSILRQVRTPEEIFKARVERKLVRKAIPDETRRKLIDILRIRKGLLTEQEIERVKDRIIPVDYDEELNLHLTDINYLKSILSGKYETRFNGLNSIDLREYAELSLRKTGGILDGLYLPVNDGYLSGATRVYFENLNLDLDTEFDNKVDYIKYFFDNVNQKGKVRFQGEDYSYSDLLSSKISDSKSTNDQIQFRNMHSDELSFILKYLKQYKLGHKEFLQDKKVLDRLHEYVARLFARSQYYTFDLNINKVGSAMHIGLILDKGYSTTLLKGYFCPNPANLPELLHIMFSSARSFSDIVPIYGMQGRLLWPV
jgi:hypothetical protein